MISMAIQHQEDQKATTQDIYKFIRDSFSYYRDFPDRKWQNVVRYTLSTNDCFVKVKPNHGRKYFSSYWIIHKDSHSWLTESNHMRRFRAFKISDIVCPNQVITSQNKTTDNSCDNLEKTSEVEKIQLHNVPRTYEVPNSIRAQVHGETESPQDQFQFNSLLERHGLDDTAFSISTVPTPKGQSHYTCQDSYSIPSSHYLTENPQGQFQCNTTLGPYELNDHACLFSRLLSTSHDIHDSIRFTEYLTESSQCKCQVMPGVYGLYDSSKHQDEEHEGEIDPIWPPQVQLNNVPESPVITSQNKMTHNSFDIMDKIPKVNKIQLDNMPRAYEVAEGSKGQVQGYIESPHGQFQFNSMPGIHELDDPDFSISTLPTLKGQSDYTCQDSYSIASGHHLTETPQGQLQCNTTLGPHHAFSKGQSHYTCQDSYSIPSGHHLTETPQGQFQCNITPGPHDAFSFSQQFLSTSHHIPDSIPFAQSLTGSPQPQCQVMPGMYRLYDSRKHQDEEHI